MRRAVLLSILSAYLAVTAAGVVVHEAHRDEAQRWLLARDAGSVAEMLRHMPYEGTPGLWPLLLRPLARMGLPVAAMSWFNWAVMGAAAAVVLFFSPFPVFFGGLLLLSYFMVYEYAVIARNYSLSILLLAAVLALRGRRRERPWVRGAALLLLVNSSVFGALLALPHGLLDFRDRRAGRWVPAALFLAGWALLAAQLVPPAGEEGSLRMGLDGGWRFSSALAAASGAVFPQRALELQPPVLAGPLLLAAAAVGLLARPRALFCYLGAAVPLVLVFSRWETGLRHHGFLLLALVAALWTALAEEDPRPPGRRLRERPLAWTVRLAAAVLAVSLPGSWMMLSYDRYDPFSGASDLARAMVREGLTRLPVAAHPGAKTLSLLPHLPGVVFYYPGVDRFGTFVRQDSRLRRGDQMSPHEALARAREAFHGRPQFLMLLAHPLVLAGEPSCRLLHPADEHVFATDERFNLYLCASPP